MCNRIAKGDHISNNISVFLIVQNSLGIRIIMIQFENELRLKIRTVPNPVEHS